MEIEVFEYSNSGGRSYNEDSVGSISRGEHGLFLVADGLGGHQFGEVASACVRDTLLEQWNPNESNRAEWLEAQIKEANKRILDIQEEKNAVLKSTVVVLTIDGPQAVWANVGDSRLYYLHRDEIWKITEDHSVAYKKYRAGEITREQIGQDEDQSCLLRTLGSEDRAMPDIWVNDVPVEAGDAFMLCSDGVWEYLKDEEILIDLLKSETPREWAENLLVRMMARIPDGNDNLSLLTVMVQK